jgi:hypothetical protein
MDGEIRGAEKGMRPYTSAQIKAATLIFGPLASGYLISRNFRLLGDAKAERLSLFLAAAYTTFLFYFAMAVPEDIRKILGTGAIVISVALAHHIVDRYQRREIDNLLLAGHARASGWKVFLIGLIGLAVTMILCMILFSFFTPASLKDNTEAWNNKNLRLVL